MEKKQMPRRVVPFPAGQPAAPAASKARPAVVGTAPLVNRPKLPSEGVSASSHRAGTCSGIAQPTWYFSHVFEHFTSAYSWRG